MKETRRTETSKYPEEEKESIDSPSSGERRGKSLNRSISVLRGSGTHIIATETSRSGMERPIKEGNNPVGERRSQEVSIPSTTGHEESRGNQRGPSRKAKYSLATDSA